MLVVGACLAETVASGCDLQRLAGVSQESRHILNERLAVALALEEQGAQRVMRAQTGWRVCWFVVFHLAGLSIRIVMDEAISWKKCRVGWRQ